MLQTFFTIKNLLKISKPSATKFNWWKIIPYYYYYYQYYIILYYIIYSLLFLRLSNSFDLFNKFCINAAIRGFLQRADWLNRKKEYVDTLLQMLEEWLHMIITINICKNKSKILHQKQRIVSDLLKCCRKGIRINKIKNSCKDNHLKQVLY